MINWISKKIKLWQATKQFARQCELLLDDFNGKKIKNYLEVEMLHPETGNFYFFTIRRAEGYSPAEKAAVLTKIISNLLTEEQLDTHPLCLEGKTVRQWLGENK